VKEFEAQREAALHILQGTGIRRSNYCPPLLRLLWRLGFKVPPPHFSSFVPTAFVSGTLFTFAWGLTMWLLLWRSTGTSPALAVGSSVAAGALFGVAMSAYYAHGRKKHGLPDWNSLGSSNGA
jgi:Family of unknown function (DUF6404)